MDVRLVDVDTGSEAAAWESMGAGSDRFQHVRRALAEGLAERGMVTEEEKEE